MKYRVLSENSSYVLAEKVEKLLEGGWKLQGGITTAYLAGFLGDVQYCQAMVKE